MEAALEIANLRFQSPEPRNKNRVPWDAKPPSPAGRMTAVWDSGCSQRLFGLLAAVLATDLALVLAAFDAGFAFVGAAFFAGVTSEGAGAEGGQGEEGEKRFHGCSEMNFGLG
jgi:hypothetical protein